LNLNSEIITIGTEILLGQILDTNTQYLAQRLAEIGINVRYKTCVGDNLEDIVSAINIATSRCDVVITTGGLGPTLDDLTREAVAKSAGVKLEFREELLRDIIEIFDRIGYTMTENNKRQAYVPEGSIAIPNKLGTAPGFIKEINGVPVVCLPGVPRELKYLMENEIIPWLKQRFSLDKKVIYSKVLKVVGTGESKVDRMLSEIVKGYKNPEIGLLASEGEVKIRITAQASSRQEAESLVGQVAEKIKRRFGKKIYGEDEDVLEEVICKLLQERDLSISILETFSGGRAAQKLVSCGCPALLEAKVITKKEFLESLVGKKIESVERDISIDLAEKVRHISEAKLGLSILGFPLKKGSDFLVRACAAVSGNGISMSYIWTMGGDFTFLQERAAVIGLNTLRLALLEQV
jgi:nicotinamide-nucleotide amidase